MRILHINSYYSVSPFYRHLYDRQAEMGEDIKVYVPVARGYDAKGRDFGPYALVSESHGRFDHVLFHLKHEKILSDVKRRYDIASFNMLHAHTLFSNGYVAFKLSEAYGVPYIVAVRNSDINVFFRRMPHLRALGRRILSGAERVIFLSAAYRDGEIRAYLSAEEYARVLDKAVVLPNGIAPMWLKERGAARTLNASQPVRVLSVGDVNANKNFETTIAAVKKLRDEKIDARLTVIGRPVDAARVRMVKECPFATYREPVAQGELVGIYRAHDVFVLPSYTETFGLVYAEAMSQGLPVVYSKGQGFDGQFPLGEVGFSAPAGDAGAIAGRVKDILGNYAGMSARCVERCAKFDWDEIARAYGGVYRGEPIAYD